MTEFLVPSSPAAESSETTPSQSGVDTGRFGIGHIVALAVIVRLLHVVYVAPTPILSYHVLFTESDMYMFDSWAHRIAGGDVLGRERCHYLTQWQLALVPQEKWGEWFGLAPTYYKAPFYAYLIALLYWLFGDAMMPLVLLQILASAVAVLLLFRIGQRLFGKAVGLLAALFLALYGPAVHFDVLMLRGPWIVLVSLWLTWRLLELRREASSRNAWILGMSAGTLAVVNEGFAPTLALVAVLVALWSRGFSRLTRSLVWFGVGVGFVTAPIVARNYAVGAPLFKFAVTGSTVFAVFNSAGSSPYFFDVAARQSLISVMEAGHGRLLPTAVASFRSFSGPGAVALFYLKKSIGLLVPFENPDNVNFYYAALKSPLLAALPAYGFLLPLTVLGLGLALKRRSVALASLLPVPVSLFAAIMLTLPLSRYRATLAVYFIPMAALAVVRAAEWARNRRLVRLTAGSMAVVGIALGALALQERTLFAEREAGAIAYRAPEFLLGVHFYESQGRLREASREAYALARLNPRPDMKAMALLTVGNLEARQGHATAAREALNGAVVLGARQPGVLMAVGDIYASAALSDRASARAAFRAALDLPVPDDLREQIRRRITRLEGAQPGE